MAFDRVPVIISLWVSRVSLSLNTRSSILNFHFRFCFAVLAASLLGTGLGLGACGGSSEATSTDGGVDGAADARPGVAIADVDVPPACDTKRDLLKEIPDAAIPDSSTSTGACFGCARTKCGGQIDECAADCSRSKSDLGCQDIGKQTLECFAEKQDFIACGAGFFTASASTRSLGVALGGCVSRSCSVECGAPVLTDASVPTDASTDARDD